MKTKNREGNNWGWKILGQERRRRTEKERVKNILETEKLFRTKGDSLRSKNL